jgi:hypothetical protein
VKLITRQYCNYNPLYSLAPSKIITSKRRDQPSTYVYVALFILGKTTLFIVTPTPRTVNSFKVVSARQLRIPHYLRKMSETSRTRTRPFSFVFEPATQTATPLRAYFETKLNNKRAKIYYNRPNLRLGCITREYICREIIYKQKNILLAV